MSYKRQLLVLFFLLISSYSFSAKAQSNDDSIENQQHNKDEKVLEMFNEKMMLMTRVYERNN